MTLVSILINDDNLVFQGSYCSNSVKADKYIIHFNLGNVLVMYNSSKTISVQEVNNHDWFFYKLSGESQNNGSIFLNSKQYFHL